MNLMSSYLKARVMQQEIEIVSYLVRRVTKSHSYLSEWAVTSAPLCCITSLFQMGKCQGFIIIVTSVSANIAITQFSYTEATIITSHFSCDWSISMLTFFFTKTLG